MKISTKGRYGLRTLMDVAFHQAKGPVNLNDIAERRGVPEGEGELWRGMKAIMGDPRETIRLRPEKRAADGDQSGRRPRPR